MKPMLLDTSALQNMRYMSEFLHGSFLTDDDAEYLRRRHGRVLGEELFALGGLINIYSRNGLLWLISETSLIEFARATGEKGRRLLDWWWEWVHYMQGCIDAEWYSEIDVESLAAAQNVGRRSMKTSFRFRCRSRRQRPSLRRPYLRSVRFRTPENVLSFAMRFEPACRAS